MFMNAQSQDGDFGSEGNNNTSSEAALLGLGGSSSSLSKKELDEMVIGVVKRLMGGPVLGPLIPEAVKEDITLAVEKIVTSMRRNPGDDIHPSESRSLELRFSNQISPPVLTGEPIKGKECESMMLTLVDAVTGEVVNSGPLASAKVEIVVLEGDFEVDGRDWTPEEFNQKVVKEGEGKGSLLNRKTHFNLREGVAILDGMSFRHSSKWMKHSELRLGARFVENPNGTRVREAKTEAFPVRDRRKKLYEKHYPPSLDDEVWRLINIGRKGQFHERLKSESISTVKDFLREYNINPERLRNILRAGDKAWDAMVKHARTCPLDKTVNSHSPANSQPKIRVVFKVVGRVLGLLSETRKNVRMGMLSDSDKVIAHKLVVSAYEHSNDIVPFDDEASIVFNAEIPSIPLKENPIPCTVNYALAIDTFDCIAGADGLYYSLLEFENDLRSNFPAVPSFYGQQTYDTQNSNLRLPHDLMGVEDAIGRRRRNRTVYFKVVVKLFALHRVVREGNTRGTKRQRCC